MSLRFKGTVVLIAMASIAGCGDDSSSEDTTATPVATTVTTTTTEAVATTIAATTTVESTTTAPEYFILTLRSDGIGPWDFGTPFDEVVDGLVAEFDTGQPIDSFEYVPDPAGSGLFEDPSENEAYFAYASIRRACWFGNGLCLYFGGASQDALTLTGWRNSAYNSTYYIWTAEGVMIGSELSEAPPVTGIGLLCDGATGALAEYGVGHLNGIDLKLHATGGGFTEIPLPDATITAMEAGELIIVEERMC